MVLEDGYGEMPEKCLACGSRNTGSSVPHDNARKEWQGDGRVKIKKTHYCYDCGSYFTDDSSSNYRTYLKRGEYPRREHMPGYHQQGEY